MSANHLVVASTVYDRDTIEMLHVGVHRREIGPFERMDLGQRCRLTALEEACRVWVDSDYHAPPLTRRQVAQIMASNSRQRFLNRIEPG